VMLDDLLVRLFFSDELHLDTVNGCHKVSRKDRG